MGSRQVENRFSKSNKAVFLDRDGVLTRNVYYERWGEWEAPMCPEDVEFLPDVENALLSFQHAGYLLFIVSNQGAFAKGKTRLESLTATADHVGEKLSEAGINISEAYYSYTHPWGTVPGFSGESLERKPGSYFLYVAAARYGLNLSDSWMIGDRSTDVLCGKKAGCKTIQIFDPATADIADVVPDFKVRTLQEAVPIILRSGGE